MANVEEIYCWVCGDDSPQTLYFRPFTRCVRVVEGKYICEECCKDCSIYSICSEKDWAQWAVKNKRKQYVYKI